MSAVLAALRAHPESSAPEIAAAAGVSARTAGVVLRRLVREGLVNRYRFGNDAWRYIARDLNASSVLDVGGEADAPQGLPSSESSRTSIYKQGAEE